MERECVRLNNYDDWKKWFPFTTYELMNTNNKDIVFCFHHAGGCAASYRKWTIEKGEFNFVCVELPGKGTRRKEKFISDYNLLVQELCESVLKSVGSNRFIFFGHSMGAALAFYTTFYMKKIYKRQPFKLIVAGRQAPDEENLVEFKTYMDDCALIQELERYKATPKEVLENKEILDFILPEIRRDYKLNESFSYSGEILDIPLIVHAGRNDTEANMEIMKRWENVTNKGIKIREFNGDHFFVLNSDNNYFCCLIEDLLKE